MIRLATNRDSQGVIELIAGCLSEYDDQICLEEGGAESELLDLETNYAQKGGQFWVLEITGRVMGSHATLPDPVDPTVCGFRRLYLHPSLRGETDWGHRLMQITIEWARTQGFQSVQFWSDTRFERAHHFFRKFGFRHDGRRREMHDSHQTYWEYFFQLEL